MIWFREERKEERTADLFLHVLLKMFPSLRGRGYLKLANEMCLVRDLGLCLFKLGFNPRMEGRMHTFEIEAIWQRKSKTAA